MSCNRLRVLLASLLAVFAVSAVASASASATGQCYKVITATTGTFEEPTCVGAAGTKAYIKVISLEKELTTPSEWCAKVAKPTGKFSDAACSKEEAGATEKEFIKVHVPTFWVCKNVGAGKGKYKDHECKVEGGEKEWDWKPVIGAESFPFEGTSGVSLLETNIGATRVIIECKKDKITGEDLGSGGRTTGVVITYEECKLFTVSKYVKTLTICKVPNIVTAKLNDFLIMGKGAGPEDEFEPAAGTSFATVVIKECAGFEGEYEVKGKQICQLPEAPVGLVTHEIVCSPSGGSLKFGATSVPASYYGTSLVKLTNGWAWGAEP